MKPPPAEPHATTDAGEDAFARLLVAWDEQLAEGSRAPTPPVDDAPDASGLRERLQRAQDCVLLLNELWPKGTGSSAVRRREGTLPVNSRFGRYQIHRELGRGGHGVVFLAADPSLKRQIALKMPRPSVLADPELRARFLREAEATARLDHPNILQVYEVGREGPVCYTAAAYCDGGTLQEWLAGRHGPLAARQAAQIVAELAAAIHHAHTRGVLHRDLKPSNVLLASRHGDGGSQAGEKSTVTDGGPSSALRRPAPAADPQGSLLDHWVPKIADFGLAKVVDCQQDSTLHGVVMGTANYMAPEQAEGRNADVGVTSDVYSLGVILYELLTGAPPLVSPSKLATLSRAGGDDAAWPSRLRRRIPADLRTICLTCLQHDPQRRYPSAGALAEDLQRFLRGETVSTRPVRLPERLWRTVRKHPALSLLSLLAIGLAIGFVVQLFCHTWALERTNAQLAIVLEKERQHAKTMTDLRQLALRQAEENRRHSLGAKLRVVQQFADAGSLRQMTEVLHETFPDADQEPDLREFAWRYWWHRCRRAEIFRLPGHGQFVYDAAFSPDGRLLATASADGTVRIWEYERGLEVARLYGLEESVRQVVFSPQGSLVAACDSHGHVRIWSTADWKGRPRIAAHGGEIRGLVFGSESSLISGGLDGWLRAWNVQTGEVEQAYQLARNRYVNCLAVAPRQNLLLVGVHNGEIQWRTLTNLSQRIGMMPGHKENVHSMAVTLQEDRVFSSDHRGDLRIWDLATRKSMHLIEDGAPYASSPTAVSADGRWLAAVADRRNVRIFDAQTGAIVHERFLDIDNVAAVEFSKDARALLVAGSDGKVVFWHPFDQRPAQPAGHDDGKEAWSAVFTRDGTLITGGDDDHIKFWQPLDGSLRTVLSQPGTVAAMALSADGTLMATTSLEELDLNPGNVRLWKMPEGELVRSLEGHAWKAYSAAFHPQENVLATGSREVIVWDVASGRARRTLEDSRETNKKVKSIAFSPDGALLAFASEDGHTYLYSYPELKRLGALESGGEVWAVAFSPDGQSLAAGNRDGSVTIWNPHTQTPQLELKGHLQGVRDVKYSHDGQTIATGSEDMTIKLWGPVTGQELCTLHGHSAPVTSVAFSPDDQWLGSTSFDGAVRLWYAPHVPGTIGRPNPAQEKRP